MNLYYICAGDEISALLSSSHPCRWSFYQFWTRVWTDRGEGALADLPLSLCDIVDLALVPLAGPLHHFQARQQRVLLLLQLFHLLQLCESKVKVEDILLESLKKRNGGGQERGSRGKRTHLIWNRQKRTCLKSISVQISHRDRTHLMFIFPMPSPRQLSWQRQD